MRKFSAVVLSILLLLGGLASAEVMWAQGWSQSERLLQNSFDSRRTEFPQIQVDNQVLSLGYDNSTKEMTLVTYDISTAQLVETISLGQAQELLSFDLAKGEDGVHVVWVDQVGGQREFYHVVLGENLNVEPKLIHQTSNSVRKILVAPGQSNTILWNELVRERGGFVTLGMEIGQEQPVEIQGFTTPSEPHDLVVDDAGGIHLLWNMNDNSRDIRLLNYAYITPELEMVSNTELGDTSLQENPSGNLLFHNGTVHIVWTQVYRGSFGGRNPVSVRYQSFEDGQPTSEPNWIMDPWASLPDIAITDDDVVRVVWSTSTGGSTGREIFIGDLDQDNLITNVERITYSTTQYTMPRVFHYQGHDYVQFQQISLNHRVLHVINNQYPVTPSVWTRLGLDPGNVLGSVLYRVGFAFAMAGVSAIMSSLPVIISTLLIYGFHKILGPPKSTLGYFLQMLFVCTMIFLQLSVYNAATLQVVNVEGVYQIALFAGISIVVMFLFSFIRGNKDEPFIYGGAGFIWLFFWFFLTAITQIPFVIT